MIDIIPVFVTLVTLAAIILTNKTGEKPNGNILLGVTLPHSELTNETVTKIAKEYRKAYMILGAVFLALIIPLLFNRYISVELLYILVWCITLFYMNGQIQKTYFQKLYTLKKKNGWFTGKKDMISIDTEVSKLKGKMLVSKWWFVVAFALSLIPIIMLVAENETNPSNLLMSAGALIIVAICFFIYTVISKERTVTYSENTEINIALNYIYKYQRSKCWVIEAFGGTVLGCSLFTLFRYDMLHSPVAILLIFMSTCFIMLPILSSYNTIRNERQKLLIFDATDVYTDNDQYWETGTYNNPNDKQVWVEKRVGYGTTINMATPAGKITNVILAAVIVGVVGLSIYLSPLDFGSVNFFIVNDSATITAPMYSDDFTPDQIEHVELIENLPSLRKHHGGDSPTFYVGDFNVMGYGNCSVYVRRNNTPYIVITLDNRTIIFNGNTPEDTENYYLQLSELQ